MFSFLLCDMSLCNYIWSQTVQLWVRVYSIETQRDKMGHGWVKEKLDNQFGSPINNWKAKSWLFLIEEGRKNEIQYPSWNPTCMLNTCPHSTDGWRKLIPSHGAVQTWWKFHKVTIKTKTWLLVNQSYHMPPPKCWPRFSLRDYARAPPQQ